VTRIRSTLRSNLAGLWTLLAAVLIMRALVPMGWMPDFAAGDGFGVRICGPADIAPRATPEIAPAPTGHGSHAMPGDAEADAAHTDHESEAAHSSIPCMFSGFANAATPPDAPTLVALALPQPPLRSVEPERIRLTRARYIRPPGRAPPVRA